MITMPDVHLQQGDATELAELLAFLADWLTGTDTHTLADSLTRFVGTRGYDRTTLLSDLRRFEFLLGASDGEDLFGEPQH
jgi:hypothetical protein